MLRVFRRSSATSLPEKSLVDTVNNRRAGRYRWGMGVTTDRHDDEPPRSASLTAYDRTHLKLYLRLLDAEADGAAWQEIVQVLFDIDPTIHPDRARRMHDAHLARAHWMTEQGYRDLLWGARH